MPCPCIFPATSTTLAVSLTDELYAGLALYLGYGGVVECAAVGTLWETGVQRGTVWCSIVHYSAVEKTMVKYGSMGVECSAVACSAVWVRLAEWPVRTISM